MIELVAEYRIKMLEALAEFDDELMIKYLDGKRIPVDEIKEAIRKGTLIC